MGRLLKVCMWEMTGVGNIPSPCGVSEWEDLLQLREEDPSAVPGGLGSGTTGLRQHPTTTVSSLTTMAGLLCE